MAILSSPTSPLSRLPSDSSRTRAAIDNKGEEAEEADSSEEGVVAEWLPPRPPHRPRHRLDRLPKRHDHLPPIRRWPAAPAPAPNSPPPAARWPGSYGSVQAASANAIPMARAPGTSKRLIAGYPHSCNDTSDMVPVFVAMPSRRGEGSRAATNSRLMLTGRDQEIARNVGRSGCISKRPKWFRNTVQNR
jgi:hypothetical protein